MKVRPPGSISRATAVNWSSPVAVQRTGPEKSDVSAVVRALDIQEVCPLAAKRMLTTTPSTSLRRSSQRTSSGLASRL